MGLDEFDGLKEEALREELRKIREERAGKGRIRKAKARTRRIEGAVKDKKRRDNIKSVEDAEWI